MKFSLLLFLLLLSSALFGLSLQEKMTLTLFLKRYENNESSLIDQQRLSNLRIASLSQNQKDLEEIILRQSEIIKSSNQKIQSIELSSTVLQKEVKKQKSISSGMEGSITTLQNSFDRQQLQIKVMKYVIIGLAGTLTGVIIWELKTE